MKQKTNKEVKAEARRNYRSHWRRKGKGLGPRGSSTPGAKKVDTCQASMMDRYFAGSARSYKHPGYAAWCASHKGLN